MYTKSLLDLRVLPKEIYIQAAENLHRVVMCVTDHSGAAVVLMANSIYLVENIYTIAMYCYNRRGITFLPHSLCYVLYIFNS
jgi:hypothetical protein